MKRILLAFTKVAFEPDKAMDYHPILGFEPEEMQIDAVGLLLLYAAALIPYWVGAAILELPFAEVFPSSMLIWGIGLALGGIHPNVGLLAVLALGLLATVNDSFRGTGVWVEYDLWPIGLMFVYLPASFVLQALARSSKKSVYRWLQVGLTVIGGVLGTIATLWYGELTAAHIWTSVALGALSLVGSSEIGEEEESLSAVSAIVATLAALGMSWHLYALVFPPDAWSVWLRIVQGLFTVLVTSALAFVVFVMLAMAEEQDQAFDHSWQLLFFVYAALAWLFPLPLVLLIGLVAVVWTWLAFPTWHTFRRGTSVPGRVVAVVASAVICAFVTAMLVRSYTYRLSLMRLFLPDDTLDLDPYSLFAVVGILFTLSVVHWSTILAAAGTSIGPLLARGNVPTALGLAAGLAAVGALLGYTHLLLWPFLSLLTLWLRRRVQRADGPTAEACLLAARLGKLYEPLPGSLGTNALLAALARKGVHAGAFGSETMYHRYRTAQVRWYTEAVGSAPTLEEALRIDTTSLAEEGLEQAVESLRAAREVPGDILRVRAFATAIQNLTAVAEASRESVRYQSEEVFIEEDDLIPEGEEAEDGDVLLLVDGETLEGDPSESADVTSPEADEAPESTALLEDAEMEWVEDEASETADFLPLLEALETLRGLAYEAIRLSVETYWETYSTFPEFASTDVVAESHSNDRREIQSASEHCLSRIREFSKELSSIRPHREKLPGEEQRYSRELEDVTRRLTSMPREMDYQARSRVMEESGFVVNKMRGDLPPTWLSIAPDEHRVVEHANPWYVYTESLEQQISCLAELNERMFEWVTAQVVEALEEIQEVDDFTSLTGNLYRISGFGERYGPLIDVTIKSLESIGRDATAALAFPRGYSRRLGLQDALDLVNKLRSDLSTRYLLEAADITDSLERVAQVLFDHLFAAAESEAGVYRNPYIAGNPINLDRAALFKGRIELAEEIVALLRHRGNPTVVLYGPRRMGKTSFLLQLPRLLPSDYLPVFLDMQRGGAQQSDGSFTYALANAIWRQLRSEASIERPDLDEHERHPYTAMDRWLDDVQPLVGKRILFLTIDEFETIGKAIKRGTLTVQVLEHLRSLMQHQGNLLLMFAGVQTIEALGPDPASYFISAHPVEISYLHPREAEALIRNPDPGAGKMPDYDDEVVAGILHRTHRQPYLIQAICSEIIEMANVRQLTRIRMENLDEAAAKVLSTSLLFQYIWDDAEDEGQRLLTRLAAEPQRLDETQLAEGLLAGLLRRHVITETSGVYEIEIPLVRDWIRREVG